MTSLSASSSKFILHWGELGTRWGLNKTVAKIHALLYVSAEPLHAERIAGLLNIARSNVSSSLRELQGWGIVRVVHVLGDRRDHFESLKDVWEMFQIILDERKRREIDPTLAILRQCAAEPVSTSAAEQYAHKRIKAMLVFFEETTSFYEEVRRMPVSALRQILRLKTQVKRLISGGAA
jgi:DNA-binding transcriptional regulator GbsR (MarR family)